MEIVVIIGIIFIAICIFGAVSGTKLSEETREKLKENKIGFDLCKYLGGHPEITHETSGTLLITKKEIIFEIANHKIEIPIEKIISAEFKTEEQISKDVTLTRLIALGVFAFAFKKKTVDKKSYLVIRYKDFGTENAMIFETPRAPRTVSLILKAKRECCQETPQLVEDNKSKDIPEQIKKLADLKNSGILTEDEFQEKKKQLLERL